MINYRHKIFCPFNTKIYLLDHPLIKYDIFEVNVTFPPRSNPIGIVAQYCEHHNIPCASHSTNIIPCNHTLSPRNRPNVWILIIGRKDPTTVPQVMEVISSQHITGRFIRIHVITSRRGNNCC